MTQIVSLKEQLKALEHLQELDLKIDSLNKNKSALPAALKTLDDSLGKLKLVVNAKKAGITEIEKVLRQTKAALDLNKDRLARSTSRLEGVQNSQEFQAINKELDQLRKLNGTFEEQLKKSTDALELDTKTLGELDEKFQAVQKERDEKALAISGQAAELQGDINQILTERKTFTVKVDPRILANYDRVRGARAGLGISPAVGGRCKACNMMVPPQLYNEVQKGLQLQSCPSCHRILYIPHAEATPAEKAVS